MVVVGTSELRTLWQAAVYIESPHNVRLRNVSYGCGGYLRVTDARGRQLFTLNLLISSIGALHPAPAPAPPPPPPAPPSYKFHRRDLKCAGNGPLG